MTPDPGPRRTLGRGWGPFTGRQLTLIVCVAIVAAVAIPTATFAAVGSFTSATATPAVRGTNTSNGVPNAKGVEGLATGTNSSFRYGVAGKASGTNGIGVQGTGNRYGVFSDGPLGVAGGNTLHCTGCVGPRALSASAKAPLPLGSGQSQSGAFGAGAGSSTSGLIGSAITFVRPLPVQPTVVYTGNWPVAHCSGPGHADPMYLCMYEFQNTNTTFAFTNFASPTGSTVWGTSPFWNVTGSGAFVEGAWTVTAT